MDDKSYSPPSGDSSEHLVDCSQVSLRSFGSQMSISSAVPSLPSKTLTSKRKHRIFGAKSHHRKRGKVVSRKLKFPKVKSRSILPETVETMPSFVEQLIPELDGRSSNIVLNLANFRQVLDSMAKCSQCDGKLVLFESGTSSGCASYLSLKCSNCVASRKFWSVGAYSHDKISIRSLEIPKRNSMVYCSVLAGRLMGVGWHKLFMYHSMLNIPGPVTSRNFGIVQANILVAAEATAVECMVNARDQLRSILNTDPSLNHVPTVGTFDGAFQQRSGKSGGGFSRYCFAAAIIAQTGKVISYDIGCNSCAVCSRINNRYHTQSLTLDDFNNQKAIHKHVCPAEYSELSSVHLESAIAPKVISDALERGVIFSAIVSDGDNKTHDTLEKAAIYQHLPGSPSIERFECIAHVAKRMKGNLFKRQEKVLTVARADKAAKSREIAKKGTSKAAVKKVLDKEFRGKLQRSSKCRETWQSTSSEEIRHLSVSMCAQIASYYRLAVQRHSGNVPAILNAIRAIPLHLSANDYNAEDNHVHCPFTSDSWCRYQSAKFNGQLIPTHPNFLGADATNLIVELFRISDTIPRISSIKFPPDSPVIIMSHSTIFFSQWPRRRKR